MKEEKVNKICQNHCTSMKKKSFNEWIANGKSVQQVFVVKYLFQCSTFDLNVTSVQPRSNNRKTVKNCIKWKLTKSENKRIWKINIITPNEWHCHPTVTTSAYNYSVKCNLMDYFVARNPLDKWQTLVSKNRELKRAQQLDEA